MPPSARYRCERRHRFRDGGLLSAPTSVRGEVLFEKTHEDPEITVEHDTLTVRVPATILPMRADAAYRVMLEKNGATSLMLKARKGRTVAGACSG